MRNFYRAFGPQSYVTNSPKRGHMNIPKLSIALLILILPAALLCQTVSVKPALLVGGGADTKEDPKLEHFDPAVVDKTLDPCNSFYKYTCNKWLTSNPIPPDQ